MIYVSSACVKTKSIKQTIEILVNLGFTNIELTGGTNYYEGLNDDLNDLKERYGLNFILHHYFPPEKGNPMLNLCSPDNKIYEKTICYFLKSINLSKELKINKFGFHAGFYVALEPREIGHRITHRDLANKEKAMARFCEGYKVLSKNAAGEVGLYIENNVFSGPNKKTFGADNPFMLTTFKDYQELRKRIEFKLLLDVGHLKVSCQSLGLNFDDELKNMAEHSDYYHLNDNNGLEDQNLSIAQKSDVWEKLKKYDLERKTLTLEIYDGVENLKESFNFIARY